MKSKLTHLLKLYNEAFKTFSVISELPSNHAKRFKEQYSRVFLRSSNRLDRRRKALFRILNTIEFKISFDYSQGYAHLLVELPEQSGQSDKPDFQHELSDCEHEYDRRDICIYCGYDLEQEYAQEYELAETLTVALPMPDQDGQSNTIGSICASCTHGHCSSCQGFNQTLRKKHGWLYYLGDCTPEEYAAECTRLDELTESDFIDAGIVPAPHFLELPPLTAYQADYEAGFFDERVGG